MVVQRVRGRPDLVALSAFRRSRGAERAQIPAVILTVHPKCGQMSEKVENVGASLRTAAIGVPFPESTRAIPPTRIPRRRQHGDGVNQPRKSVLNLRETAKEGELLQWGRGL